MDHYKTLVMDYLQSDRAVFVNAECCLPLDDPANLEKRVERCSCDAVALDLRHGAVYLCETALDDQLQSLMRKLSAWTKHWDSIRAALQRDYKVPANWRVHVWLFVPRGSIDMLDGKLEHLRQTIGPRFKVKLTALEDVQPWRFSSWERCEEAWESNGQRVLS
ncbi:MAG: hypothetical protein WB679_12860 [Terracidiphilus sp.]